jgi:hypothetical protein
MVVRYIHHKRAQQTTKESETMTKTKISAAKKIYTADQFSVGDFVRLRQWTVPCGDLPQEPLLHKKVMRIVSTFSSCGTTVFVCGGNRQFEAFELVPA